MIALTLFEMESNNILVDTVSYGYFVGYGRQCRMSKDLKSIVIQQDLRFSLSNRNKCINNGPKK
jgi:hypothetical protein